MGAAAKEVGGVGGILRSSALIGDLVALVAFVDHNNILLVLDGHAANGEQKELIGPHVDDFKTVLVGILGEGGVRQAAAIRLPMVEGEITAFFAAGLIVEIGLSAEGLDRLLDQSTGLAGVLVVGRGRRRGARCRRLTDRHSEQQKN